jgi:hypothetical protein
MVVFEVELPNQLVGGSTHNTNSLGIILSVSSFPLAYLFPPAGLGLETWGVLFFGKSYDSGMSRY